MKINNILKLVISIFIPLLVGYIGSLLTSPSIPVWYAGLVKSSLNPPSWVFGPVWTALFILMGISFFLIWKQTAEKKVFAYYIFFAQLILNVLWSFIFFGMQNPGLALIEIFILWVAILVNIIAFYKISKKASYLLIPYILWVSFAIYLNASIGYWIGPGGTVDKIPLNDNPNAIACTMEAKMCPDGTFVGRTGPKCEFSPCPLK